MRWLIRVFNTSFVVRFYQAHLLAFLFFALAMFGMADGSSVLRLHYYILQSAFTSPFILTCLWLLWLAYSANGLRYMLNTLGKDEFRFLYTGNSAPTANLIAALLWTAAQINAPIILYGVAGAVIGIQKAAYLNSIAGALGLALVVAMPALVTYYKLVSQHKPPLYPSIKMLPAFNLKTNQLSILLRHISYNNKAALIATKLFSCIVLYGAHYEWGSFNYDIRWMQVAMCISIPAQGILLYQIWGFENMYLSFTRNFPAALSTRYLSILALVLILLIPELALLSSYCIRFHVLWQLPIYLCYAIGLPMLCYAMLYTKGFTQDSFNSFLFAIAMATFFITLFGFTWLLGLAFLPISFMVYKESFYQYETAGKEE